MVDRSLLALLMHARKTVAITPLLFKIYSMKLHVLVQHSKDYRLIKEHITFQGFLIEVCSYMLYGIGHDHHVCGSYFKAVS